MLSRFLISILIILLPLQASASCVILLHGLARSNSSMKKLERALQSEGYQTVNVDYPSRKFPVEILAETAIAPAIDQCSDSEGINFVTHSMGGILVRQYLKHFDIPDIERVVMLAPPNQGSEVVDRLKNVPGFHFINGEAGMQLGTGELSVPGKLGRADFDVGIIAGTRSINWILSMLIPGKDDGKVSIERTRLAGMNDHLVVAATHPFIMKNDKVIAQVSHYLKYGQFKRNDKKMIGLGNGVYNTDLDD